MRELKERKEIPDVAAVVRDDFGEDGLQLRVELLVRTVGFDVVNDIPQHRIDLQGGWDKAI
jgi:hypothetical protein